MPVNEHLRFRVLPLFPLNRILVAVIACILQSIEVYFVLVITGYNLNFASSYPQKVMQENNEYEIVSFPIKFSFCIPV